MSKKSNFEKQQQMRVKIMDGKQYLQNLCELKEADWSVYEKLEQLIQLGPICESNPRNVRLLRSFFGSDSPSQALITAFGERDKVLIRDRYIEHLRNLSSDFSSSSDDVEDDEIELYPLFGCAFEIKSEIERGEINFGKGLDMEMFFHDNIISLSDFFKRSIALGTVVIKGKLSPTLCSIISEVTATYALGRINAACALARTSLERAMWDICEERKRWDYVEKVTKITHPYSKKFNKENIFSDYPPFCLRMAVTNRSLEFDKKIDKLYTHFKRLKKEKVNLHHDRKFKRSRNRTFQDLGKLDEEIENLYRFRFSPVIHGRELVIDDAKELIQRTFRAIESLYDMWN